MNNYNPANAAVPNGNFFGFPFSNKESEIIIIPIPWDVTTSFKAGTSKAPELVKKASLQLDFYDFDLEKTLPFRISTDNSCYKQILSLNENNRKIAAKIIAKIENGESLENPTIVSETALINKSSNELNKIVQNITEYWLSKGKQVALLGGDHSIPFGYLVALKKHYSNFGILQIDAHADLRNSYEGFTHSHASIMYNAYTQIKPDSLVQVAVRDVSDDEIKMIKKTESIFIYSDSEISEKIINNVSWKEICDNIISHLPQNVYLSFDIDGLSPDLCPNCGTPVPGGLSYNQAIFLIKSVINSGRKIIGFDLSETGNSDWDANVSARLLFKICNFMGKSLE